MSIDELIEDFQFLDDWEERYRHIIDLGKALPDLAEGERSDTNKVKGCASQVWLVTERGGAGGKHLIFRGESDAHIVRGLIYILIELFSDHSPEEVLAIDATNVFDRLGLKEALSPQRSNGLHAMVERIRRDAKAALSPGAG